MSLATAARPGISAVAGRTTDDVEVSILCVTGLTAHPDAQNSHTVFTFEEVKLQEFFDFWETCNKSPQASYAWRVAQGMVGYKPKLIEEGVSQTLAAIEGYNAWCLERGRISLKSHLEEVYHGLPEGVQGRLAIVDSWAEWGRWMRNHVDHGGIDEHREITNGQMHDLSTAIRLILYLRILADLGVEEERILDALSKHPRLKAQWGAAKELRLPPLPAK